MYVVYCITIFLFEFLNFKNGQKKERNNILQLKIKTKGVNENCGNTLYEV